MTTTLTLPEAANALHKSKRWLQDWLARNPADATGRPFFSQIGRTKVFRESDISRIRPLIEAIGDAPTYIYFVGMADHVKIGIATNWRKRLSGIQTGSPFPAELLLVLAKTVALEKELHTKFADHHVRGEWFKECPEIRDYIKRRKQFCVTKKERKP